MPEPTSRHVAPRYGDGALADLVPSVLGALGVDGEHDRLGLGLHDVRRVAVLLVDGMGSELVRGRTDIAPFLAALPDRAITAGFPSTTAASLGSLGTGLPSGEHGIVGYLLAVPGHQRLMNPLKWRLMGAGPRVDLLEELVPERFQPTTTAFERAAAAGVTVTQVAPMYQAGSGLTRAALRGGDFRPSFSVGDLVDGVVTALGAGARALVYAYHGDLDMTGHVRGPGSESWALELGQIDLAVRMLAERLPRDAALIVTADHGMVTVHEPVDFDRTAQLQAGVRALGGEPRARHVYAERGAADDVVAAWRDTLGADFTVTARAEAVAAGWFGPVIAPAVFERIGDAVVTANEAGAVIRSGGEPLQSRLVGHHGSLTPAEMLVPLHVIRR